MDFCSPINQPFWATSNLGNPHMVHYKPNFYGPPGFLGRTAFCRRASVLAEGGEGPEGGAEAGDVAQLPLHLAGGRVRGPETLGKP